MKNFLLLIFLFSASCTQHSTPPLSAPSSPISSVEIFLARTSLREKEFEHYKVTGDKIFRECGNIARGRNSVEEQKLLDLAPDAQALLSQKAGDVYSLLTTNNPELDKPGDNSDLMDPGQFYLTIRTEDSPLKISTSLDSLVPPTSVASEYLRSLVETVRKASNPPLCGNYEFYGLGSGRRS